MNKHILKVVISLAVIIIVIFSWSCYCSRLLTTTTKGLDNTAAALEDMVKNKKWTDAEKKLEELQESWDKTEPKWAIMIDHFEIDNIDNSMVRMSKFVEEKSSDDAIAELGSLRKFIQHIPQENALTIKNVL